MILLAIDTCGMSGSVALARVIDGSLVLLGQVDLPSRDAASTLLPTLRDLLTKHEVPLKELTALLVVDGPGSFTGVRIGMSAAKGISEGLNIPIATISRLEVLAALGETELAALDAHRNEVYLRIGGEHASQAREWLADGDRLAALRGPGQRVSVCDDAATALLTKAWPEAELISLAQPTAADALRFGLARILDGAFADPLVLDGNYLRRSDAEIFAPPTPRSPAPQS